MASETKHTPGPWRVEEGTTVIWSTNAYDEGANNVGCVVARAAQPSSWKSSRPTAEEQDANAKLIASAPSLLDAVHLFMEQWNACGPNSEFGRYFSNVRDAAKEALAILEGDAK